MSMDKRDAIARVIFISAGSYIPREQCESLADKILLALDKTEKETKEKCICGYVASDYCPECSVHGKPSPKEWCICDICESICKDSHHRRTSCELFKMKPSPKVEVPCDLPDMNNFPKDARRKINEILDYLRAKGEGNNNRERSK